MLKICDMLEVVGSGDGFTWAGKRYQKDIQCKLDRCFGNKEWKRMFHQASQVFMERLGSDHRPVLVNLLSENERRRGSFRFDKRMVGMCRVAETIKEAWQKPNPGSQMSLMEKIGVVRRSLSKWKRETDQNSNVHMQKLRNELELETSSTAPNYERICIKIEICKAFKEEEEFWKQQSRDKWLVVGDNNTGFFHASVKATRQRNQITKLVDDEGREFSTIGLMGKVATDYFEKLFKSSEGESLNGYFDGFEARVTDAMNQRLIREVTNAEIRDAVFAIKSSSSPGCDGMSSLFFQEYWDVVGEDVIREVKGFFQTGSFPEDRNLTQICLIPKVVNPTLMVDLRPISLCTVMYKIISKILVTRLKPLLEYIVSPNQSAFVPERLISDNIIIAHEMVHSLRTHELISKEQIAIKTDMSKAYDRIEWRYLEELLQAMGFHPVFCAWIMVCVRTV